MMSSYPPENSGSWTTGLCGCVEDGESCICGFCCPCILVGRNANVLDQGATSCCAGGSIYCFINALFPGLAFIYSCGYRGRLRQKFGLPAAPCGDCLTECCCNCLSISQVTRELQNRGIDPKLGYEGVRQAYEKPVQPPAQQFMQY